MFNKTFKPADVLLPVNQDMTKWSCVACDQYTSEPEYWHDVEEFVGNFPSTLKITLPEVYLDKDDVPQRIEKINREMLLYLEKGILTEKKDAYIYVERKLKNGKIRKGLIGAVDLECYDYTKGSQTLIRATEGTIVERIPPRVQVRKNAALEIPHIMLLVDDDKKTVIEPLELNKDSFEKAYDFDLMQDSGSIKGYIVNNKAAEAINGALSKLAEKSEFEIKYDIKDKGVLLFAVGDGNHSLATAKECFEQLKKTMTEKEWKNHPARYALVEVVNVHDEALDFEPIHRVVFGVDCDNMLSEIQKYYEISYEPCEGQQFSFICKNRQGTIWVKNPRSNLAVGTLQAFIDDYLKQKGGKVDYIHGEDVVEALSKQDGNIGFILPPMNKSDLFKTVILDGALPRKTFSMGHSCDKRFYLECRGIK